MVTRRRFLQGTCAAGGLLCLAGPGRKTKAQATGRKVVTITDGSAWTGDGWTDADLDRTVVTSMIRRALCELTGEPDAQAALSLLIPQVSDPAQRYGIKVNCVNGELPTHPKVALALADLLVEAGASPDRIIVYDRANGELANCGYSIEAVSGPLVYGSDQSGIGYHDDYVELTDGAVKFSRIVTDRVDHLISVPVLKNHSMAGVTLSLKNHFGSVTRPEALHGAMRNCSPGIAELCARSEIRDRTRLVLIDALFGTCVTGLHGKPDFAPMSLVASADPVAADAVGQQMINEKRSAMGLSAIDARHIRDAAALGLGTCDLGSIDHTTVRLNPVPEKPKPWLKNGSGCNTSGGTFSASAIALGVAGACRVRKQ